MRSLVIFLLLCDAVVRAAVLRTIYIDANGKDVRFEVFIDKWWTHISETARIPAGTVIKRRNGTSLLDTNETVPVDLFLQFRNPTPASRARLAFTLQRDGETRLQLAQYYPVQLCTKTDPECFQCGSASYRSKKTVTSFDYGHFQDPLSSAKVAFLAELSTQSVSMTNITWDTQFPRNQMGNSSSVNVTGWIVYLSGAKGDTGKVVVDALSQFKAFSADAVPEGFIVPANIVDVQAFIDMADDQWRQQGCPTVPGTLSTPSSVTAPIHPLPTLAQAVANWTNTFYGAGNLRSCAFENRLVLTTTIVQELMCTYDDLDLAVVIRLSDGLRFLDRLRYAPPPPPPPTPSSPQAPTAVWGNSSVTASPVETMRESPAMTQGLSGCFITNSDCGDHGSLKALSPSGCMCLCEPGWRNAGQPSSSKYYCAEYTGLTVSISPPSVYPTELGRNITFAPPPPPKEYVSESWWERMGPGGWLGLTCGLVALGAFGMACSCYGRQIWTRCCLGRWQRDQKKQQSYDQIQILRQQLQDLQRKMAAD